MNIKVAFIFPFQDIENNITRMPVLYFHKSGAYFHTG